MHLQMIFLHILFSCRLKLSPTPRKRERTTTLKEDSSAKRTRLGGSPGSSTKHHQQQQQQKMSSSSSFVSTEKDSSSSRVSSSAAGCIQIADVDPEGRFMVIKNLSNAVSEILPGLWRKGLICILSACNMYGHYLHVVLNREMQELCFLKLKF